VIDRIETVATATLLVAGTPKDLVGRFVENGQCDATGRDVPNETTGTGQWALRRDRSRYWERFSFIRTLLAHEEPPGRGTSRSE
jgi:hypothetical protein